VTVKIPEAVEIAVQSIEMTVKHVTGAAAVLALQGS
jgi:hypothetical protein